MFVVVPIVLVRVLFLILTVFVLFVLVSGVLVVLCFFVLVGNPKEKNVSVVVPTVLVLVLFLVQVVLLVLVGLAILVINPKEKNNNFMDLSPFVFTRNIPPYSPSSGLCVCGCPDCLIPPFPCTDTGPCPLICPECFCHWCHGCPSCLDCPRCPMPLPCPCW